jgi:hypothetical protein
MSLLGSAASPDLRPADFTPPLAAGGHVGASRYPEGVAERWLDIGFFAQPQFVFQTGYDFNSATNFSVPPGVNLQRTRVVVHGQAHPLLQMRIEFNLSDRLELLDSYALVPVRRWLQVQIGQFRVPFSRQELVSSSRYQFADRSLWSGAANSSGVRFIPSFDLGVMAWGWTGPRDLFEYYVGVFNGKGSNTPFNLDGFFLWAGRLAINPLGRPSSLQEGAVNLRPAPTLAIALNASTQIRQIGSISRPGSMMPEPNRIGVTSLGADLFFAAHGFSAYAEVYARDTAETDTTVTQNTQAFGWLAQLGFFIPHPALRNHLEFIARVQQFAQPQAGVMEQDELYFSYDYGPIHFVVLNDTPFRGDLAGSVAGTQLTWLRQDLTRARANRARVPWIVVVHHKPAFSSARYADATDTVFLRQTWAPVFDEFGVDIVFNGHDHEFEVSKEIDGQGRDVSGRRGTIYRIAALASLFRERRELSPRARHQEHARSDAVSHRRHHHQRGPRLAHPTLVVAAVAQDRLALSFRAHYPNPLMLVDGPAWALKTLLVAHAIAAAVLLGSSTHLALILRRPSAPHGRLSRLYATVALACFSVVFAIGACIYPNYRVRVRAEWLDSHARWVAVLFDVKENFALLVAPLLVAQWLLTRNEGDLRSRRIARSCAWIATAVLWFNAIAGLLVTSYRSV